MLLLQTLLPKQDMDAVDTMIEKGMVMMRDHLATVCQKVISELMETSEGHILPYIVDNHQHQYNFAMGYHIAMFDFIEDSGVLN
jgi:hypothetical protein